MHCVYIKYVYKISWPNVKPRTLIKIFQSDVQQHLCISPLRVYAMSRVGVNSLESTRIFHNCKELHSALARAIILKIFSLLQVE